MGRHYNKTKGHAGGERRANPEKLDMPRRGQADRLAELYGVSHDTISKAGKFAAAVETLKAVSNAGGFGARRFETRARRLVATPARG